VFEALVRHTTPVAKPDCIEEPSVTTATVTMSRSLRDLGGSMALRRGVVLVVVAESIEADSILAHWSKRRDRSGGWVAARAAASRDALAVPAHASED
jgi:hypothetical protein